MSILHHGVENTRRSVTRNPLVVLLLGLLATTACMVLLFGPFYPYLSPGVGLQYRVLSFAERFDLPQPLWDLLYERFVVVMSVVFGFFLAFLPWRRAAAWQKNSVDSAPSATRTRSSISGGISMRTNRTTSVTRVQRAVSMSFTEDGRIVEDSSSTAGEMLRSVDDMKAVAHAAGIPWREEYETPGGARAFFEVFRAMQSGGGGTATAGAGAAVAAAAVIAGDVTAADPPVTQPRSREAPETTTWRSSFSESSDPVGAQDDSDHSGSTEGGASSGYRTSQSSWSPGSSGSVYTPTNLYTSSRFSSSASDEDAEADADDEEKR